MTTMLPEVDSAFQQAYARAHSNYLATMQFAMDGQQLINEVNRWSMQAAATNMLYSASGILGQRSVQAQPGSASGAGQKGVPGQVGG